MARTFQPIPAEISLLGRPASRFLEIGRASCRASDWSSDVCSSDLDHAARLCRVNPSDWQWPVPFNLYRRKYLFWGDQHRGFWRSEERRVGQVTGVQTCALPISITPHAFVGSTPPIGNGPYLSTYTGGNISSGATSIAVS